MPGQEAQCIIDLHTISTKNHARPTFSFKPLRPNAISSPASKAARAREPNEIGIDCTQIEAPFRCNGGSGLNRRDVSRYPLLLGSGRPAKCLEQRSADPTSRSDGTSSHARHHGLQSACFGLRKNNNDDSDGSEIFAARNSWTSRFVCACWDQSDSAPSPYMILSTGLICRPIRSNQAWNTPTMRPSR